MKQLLFVFCLGLATQGLFAGPAGGFSPGNGHSPEKELPSEKRLLPVSASFPEKPVAPLPAEAGEKYRVIVSTDIGGTDPDDFQSMIHYLMYADRFDTEGLISSPYGEGRTRDIFKIIDLYEKDLPRLKAHSAGFPQPEELRAVVRQGAVDEAPARGWSKATEGSEWIIRQARSGDARPLWVLVWGGLEDLVQALHDAPDIAPKLRVYWIGGPNKKWSVNAYRYLVRNFPDLWMIESNSTYRGWFTEVDPEDGWGNADFFEKHIRGAGALGKDFVHYYEGAIKMGDTPSVAHLLYGDPEQPGGPGWGGSFVPLHYSARRVFEGNTSLADTLPVYGIIEWVFHGPEAGLKKDEPCMRVEVDGQRFDGYYQGNGIYSAWFVPKKAGDWTYRISSRIPELDGQEGAFVSADPWPGVPHADNIAPLTGWWSDDPAPELFLGGWQGALTVARWRRDWLSDWAERWSWLR